MQTTNKMQGRIYSDLGKRKNGADNRSRTYDLRITNALLYQLSYIGPERPVTSVTTGQKSRSNRGMRQCPFESNVYFCITRVFVTHKKYICLRLHLPGGTSVRQDQEQPRQTTTNPSMFWDAYVKRDQLLVTLLQMPLIYKVNVQPRVRENK